MIQVLYVEYDISDCIVPICVPCSVKIFEAIKLL